MESKNHVTRLAYFDQLEGAELEKALREIHQDPSLIDPFGRNVVAGHIRGCGLRFGKLEDAVRKDPLYQEAFQIAKRGTLLNETALMNFFLLLKYSIKDMVGDIIEFGSYLGGSAVFLAYVAMALGIKGKVYALDTFEGLPEADEHLDFHQRGDFKETSFEMVNGISKQLHLNNLVLIKGHFQETFPLICSTIQPLSLVHVDGVIYSSVKYAMNAVLPYLHPQGGYLVVDDALYSSCLGALQAVEEVIQQHDLHAEQSSPHLIYRCVPSQKS